MIKVKLYNLVHDAVSSGVSYGLRRSFKHRDDSPPEEYFAGATETIVREIMNEICEVIDFDDT